MITQPLPRRTLPLKLLHVAVHILAILLLAALAHVLLSWAMAEAEAAALRGGVILTALLLYGLLIAVPFVPGVEIGLSLLVLGGAEVAPFVYGATWLGLSGAFWAGRALPLAWLERRFLDLHLLRAAGLVAAIAPLSRRQRLARLRRRVPNWLAPMLVQWRYVTLAVLINLPGSAVIGGGGGILLLAGMSGLFRPLPTLVTIALACLPVPLAVWLWGPGLVDMLAQSQVTP